MQAAVEAVENRLPLDELEAIYQHHHGLVYRAAYRVTGDASDAEDVLQTVFLRLARRAPEADGVRGLESYLYRAAVNTALDVMRGKARKAAVPLEEAPQLASEAGGDAPDRVVQKHCSGSSAQRWNAS